MRLSRLKFNRVYRGKIFNRQNFLYDEGNYHDWFQDLISNGKIGLDDSDKSTIKTTISIGVASG